VQPAPTLQHLDAPTCRWTSPVALRHFCSCAARSIPTGCAASGRSLLGAGATIHAGSGECRAPGDGVPLLQVVQRLQRVLLFCQVITALGDQALSPAVQMAHVSHAVATAKYWKLV
jgi:hypothetical protein